VGNPFKKIKNIFHAADPSDNGAAAMQAIAIQQASERQAQAIREEGARQETLARESQATQSKQLQDQQFASNMALQQSMNQRTQASQLAEQVAPPEKEATVDLAPESEGTSDPRRKYQRGSGGSSITIA
jgi:hypothetical protein